MPGIVCEELVRSHISPAGSFRPQNRRSALKQGGVWQYSEEATDLGRSGVEREDIYMYSRGKIFLYGYRQLEYLGL